MQKSLHYKPKHIAPWASAESEPSTFFYLEFVIRVLQALKQLLYLVERFPIAHKRINNYRMIRPPPHQVTRCIPGCVCFAKFIFAAQIVILLQLIHLFLVFCQMSVYQVISASCFLRSQWPFRGLRRLPELDST